jgi:formamidopyrimidine-DNA glycosylase
MPELPEVETIRRTLLRLTLGKRISRVTVGGKRVIGEKTRAQIEYRLLGKEIADWLRRGKYLIARGEDFLLLFHFGMSGSLTFTLEGGCLGKHTHLVLGFSDRSELRYEDPRTFGRIELYPFCPLEEIPGLARLGPEPLEGTLSWHVIGSALGRRKGPIKLVLMDQQVIAGIGNIYASEILFQSSIHPEKPACDLTAAECKRLSPAIRKVLRSAIGKGGTSIISFRNAEGKKGGFQDLLQVYGREEEGCPRCNTPIRMRILGGRSTFFCPQCQKR